MKSMKKLLAVALVFVMIAALSVTALAAETVTITVTEPSDKGDATTPETYTAYKILSAVKTAELAADGPISDGDEGITYYTTAANAALLGSYFTFADSKIDDAAVKVVKATTITANDQTSAAGLLAIAKANSFPSTAVTVGQATTLDIGYYVIESSLGTQLILITTDMEIAQKNYYPSFTKAFDETPAGDTADSNAAIGDTIEYVITVTVPPTVNKSVFIEDTLDAGLSYNSDSLTSTPTGVTASVDGQKITFEVPTSLKGTEDVTVTIKYTATLTSAAVSGTVYKNTAVLKYSNFVSTPQETETITNKLTVSKIKKGTTTRLDGAVLQLQDANGNVLKLVGSGTSYRLAIGDEAGAVETFTSSKDAATVIEGLDSDLSYKVAEIEAPDGYNPLEEPKVVEANPGNDLAIEIENSAGTVLPSTGGIGTTLFYVIGAVLVLGAGVVLVTKRRVRE